MILLDMEMPKSCKDCDLLDACDNCSVTWEDVENAVDDEVIAESCPIKAEIPKNATNGDVIKAMFPNVVNSDMDLVDAFNNAKRWWNAPYRRKEK